MRSAPISMGGRAASSYWHFGIKFAVRISVRATLLLVHRGQHEADVGSQEIVHLVALEMK